MIQRVEGKSKAELLRKVEDHVRAFAWANGFGSISAEDKASYIGAALVILGMLLLIGRCVMTVIAKTF